MNTFLEQIAGLSSAEDFFEFLDVAFDPAIVRINRLHILKRFHDYLAKDGQPAAGADDDALRATYARWLEQAYGDFTASNPLKERVFKVLQDAAAVQVGAPRGAFVPLSTLGPVRRG